ncbi:MAG: cyclodeaminase/cyclohydrolase family protein [Natronincolaceae bacterium]|jgi:formiminotetrahydrofolate cyclodeaminase|nr:cyclodeaminase/cyclohydrolase family protein [Bacillota bacterium]NLK89955.1 cyclodeaminase/cyclohydrolase family protein [Clostridiales bacterium]
MFVDETIRGFMDSLESKDSTLVGGSAAALAGSLGASLMLMVGNLTFGKKAYESLDEGTRKAFQDSYDGFVRLKNELYDSIDKDKAAFDAYMEALRMPKDTDEQKEERKKALAKATADALEVPLQTAKQGLEILRIGRVFADHGNAMAITDVGVGSLMAYAGIEGALFNVYINLNSIKDEAYAAEKEAESDNIIAEAAKIRDELLKIVYNRIGYDK